MSYDYLNDLFGKFRRKKKTKFTDVENEARNILNLTYNRQITYDEFYKRFNKVIAEFLELTGNCIDEDTPLWINQFGGNVFARWRQWHILRVAHSQHPEQFNTPELEAQFREIEAMNYDRWLMDKIKYCLDNL